MNNTFNNILKEIFNVALELNKSEREKYFLNLPDDQKQYVDDVKSLLSSYENTNDFLEIASSAKKVFPEEEDKVNPLLGKHLGPYLIEKEIGYGGMGIVFIGKRDDKSFDQKVAVKVLKQGLTTSYLVKRFETERQILANLSHPNIAKLFDGGKTDDGLPYLIMEYIEGVPITDYCKENNLRVDEKLTLFNSVCSAVQYAHQNLIIHRDLKPANILVNKQGIPKLLDFGVAKLVDETMALYDEKLTQTRMLHLTPEYASPEQIEGKSITTPSDIYSLGVILYQLLTGFQPYEITGRSPFAISKTIDEEKIIKPSEVHKTKELSANEKSNVDKNKIISNTLKGDLDNIILKAMHKDKDQRYVSVQGLMNDIEKYLKGLPVSARKDSYSYRFSKFIKRHKVGVTLFVIGNILALASVGAIIYQGNIAAKERDNAQVELKKFEEINNFLLEMMESADPGVQGRDVKVYDLLEKATTQLDEKFDEHPKIKSALKRSLGSTFIGLGEYEKAKELLQQALDANVSLYGMISKESGIAHHQLGLCYDWIGNLKIADSLYKKGIVIYSELPGKPLKQLANNLNDYGTLLTNTGKFDSATTVFNRSLEIYRIYSEEKGQKEAITTNNLATNLHHQYKLDEAEKYYLEAKEILTRLLGENRPEIASIYNNLAFLYMDRNDFERSIKTFQKSYNIKKVLLGDDHLTLGLPLNNIGMLLLKMKKYDEAEESLLKAIAFYDRIRASRNHMMSLSYYWLGKVYLESGELKKSEEILLKSIDIREEVYTNNHYKTWSSKGELGICLYKQKRYNEARPYLMGASEFYQNDSYKDSIKIKRYIEFENKLKQEMKQ